MGITPEIVHHFTRARLCNSLRERDPLALWRFAVPRLREAFALVSRPRDPVDEIALQACNKGTKSETMAAFAIACAQKRPTLDGVPLPQWRGPVEAAQLVLDYPQQVLSVQPAYLRVLGQWPHHARYKGEILSSLRIMPLNGSSDETTWSVIHFLSQENRRTGTGVRGDLILFDEPANISILRELRKAAHAGRRLVTVHGFTPTIRSQWAPIREDYGDCPRSSIRRIDQERAIVRWSLHEVADWVLSKAEKEKLMRKYWGAPERETPVDPLYDARVHGDFCDTTGDCPFDLPTLQAMLAECREPERMEWEVTREVEAEDGLVRVKNKVQVLIGAEPEGGASYYLTVDPSKGIESGRHDPGGILVSRMGTGEDVALYEGYIGSYGLGTLAAGLARQYNNAVVDFESNGGWGQGVLRGLGDSGYKRIAKEQRPMEPEKWKPRLGFETTPTSRPGKIEAVQEWVSAWRDGAPYARCPFARVIQTLIDTIMDEDGKIAAAPGFHDEFLILKGQSLLKTRPNRKDPNLARAVIPVTRRNVEPTLEEIIAGAQRRQPAPLNYRSPARPKPRPS